MVAPVMIAGRAVGPGQSCFIIAEAGVNHGGDVALARRLIDAAIGAGADAVKFQTFNAERLLTRTAPKARYQVQTTGSEESQYEMVRRLELPAEAHRQLMEYAARRGITFLSSLFEEASADLLETLGVPAFKIPSGELTNLPLLRHVAHKGQPMIVSTGMATLSEVATALQAIREVGHQQVVLLHCVSDYPAEPADVNLRAMATLAQRFDVPVGLSDHTLGIEVALAAVALGACVIEKHLTLNRALPGPDHRASLEPEEFQRLVRGIRTVEAALGDGRKAPTVAEQAVAAVARKSLVAARDLRAGSVLTEELIAIKRPGTGLPPALRGQLIGRKVKVDLPADAVLTWDVLL